MLLYNIFENHNIINDDYTPKKKTIALLLV